MKQIDKIICIRFLGAWILILCGFMVAHNKVSIIGILLMLVFWVLGWYTINYDILVKKVKK